MDEGRWDPAPPESNCVGNSFARATILRQRRSSDTRWKAGFGSDVRRMRSSRSATGQISGGARHAMGRVSVECVCVCFGVLPGFGCPLEAE